MNIFRSFIALVLLTGMSAVFAHAHLEKSVPAEGSVLKTGPQEIVLTFAEPVRITALSLQKGTE